MNIIEQLMHVALLGTEWVLYLLLGLSILSFGIMIEREWFFRKNRGGSTGLRESLTHALLESGASGADAVFAKHPSVESSVLREALKFRKGGPLAIGEAVEASFATHRGRLERGMTFLGTLGNNAPFIGLFGTVIGVVVAFHYLGDGSDGSMTNVMAGIAEALIATGVGIFVALPAVVAFNVGQKRIGDIEAEVHGLSKLLAAWSRTGDLEHETAQEVGESRAGSSKSVRPARDEAASNVNSAGNGDQKSREGTKASKSKKQETSTPEIPPKSGKSDESDDSIGLALIAGAR